jgi:hypothetical protein
VNGIGICVQRRQLLFVSKDMFHSKNIVNRFHQHLANKLELTKYQLIQDHHNTSNVVGWGRVASTYRRQSLGSGAAFPSHFPLLLSPPPPCFALA